MAILEDTLVLTSKGTGETKKGRRIKVGDSVLGYNTTTKEQALFTVKSIDSTEYADIYSIITNKQKIINVTASDFIMLSDGSFSTFNDMQIGTTKLAKDTGKVVGVTYSGERRLYKLALDGTNAYCTSTAIIKGAI